MAVYTELIANSGFKAELEMSKCAPLASSFPTRLVSNSVRMGSAVQLGSEVRKRLDGAEVDEANSFLKKFQKVLIKIGICIAIAIGFIFLIVFNFAGAAWK